MTPAPIAPCPVVIGSSIAGLLVSHALCRAGVRHVLVGDRPRPGIRVGESLDLPASVALPMVVPELSRFLHPKGGVTALFGRQRVDMVFRMAEQPALHHLVRAMGLRLVPSLYQLDRLGFDDALFDLVDAHPRCTRLAGRIEGLEYVGGTDRVVAVTLPDGRRVRPTWVFDCTGPARVVGRAVGQRAQALSGRHRAIVAHLPSPPPGWWTPRTTLLKLYPELHGVRGGVWCIPMGSYTSVGVSAGADESAHLDDDALLTLGLDGMARAGVELAPFGIEPIRQTGARYTYSRMPRAHGANWMLVGAAATQAWWLSSTGLGVILAAAAIAPEVVRGEREPLKRYDTYLRHVLASHRLFEQAMNDPAPRSGAALRPLYEPLMRGNLVRLALYGDLLRTRRAARVVCPAIATAVSRWQLGTVRGVEQTFEPSAPGQVAWAVPETKSITA